MSDIDSNITDTWRRFLIEVEFSKNYHQPYLLYMMRTHRNPLLEYLLPALLYIKMVSILDEAFVTHIDNQNMSMPKKYKNSLQGRIDFLTDNQVLNNSMELHEIRKKRNGLAHDTAKQIDWKELEKDLNEVQKTLEELKFSGTRPNYEFFIERSAMKYSTEPGVLFVRDFSYGLKKGDEVIAEVSWTEKTLKFEGE